MFAFRSTIIICLFLLLSGLIFVSSYRVDFSSGTAGSKKEKKQIDELSYFNNVDYYSKEGERPLLHLKAKRLIINGRTKVTEMELPVGEAYTEDQEPVFYRAKAGAIDQKAQVTRLVGDVLIFTDDSELRSLTADYYMQKDEFHAQGEVQTKNVSLKTKDKVFINADSAISWPSKQKAYYEGSVNGKIKRSRPFEPSIFFKSDELSSDINKLYLELEGDVYLKKQDVTSNALRGEIFLENYNKKLKYYALYDDVKVRERLTLRSGKKVIRKAFAEKLEGHVREQKVILTGYPKVVQEKDVITGNVITLLENNEVVEVDDANSVLELK